MQYAFAFDLMVHACHIFLAVLIFLFDGLLRTTRPAGRCSSAGHLGLCPNFFHPQRPNRPNEKAQAPAFSPLPACLLSVSLPLYSSLSRAGGGHWRRLFGAAAGESPRPSVHRLLGSADARTQAPTWTGNSGWASGGRPDASRWRQPPSKQRSRAGARAQGGSRACRSGQAGGPSGSRRCSTTEEILRQR